MGNVTIADPGTQLTKTEYLANLTTIIAEFNGNIDNTNIKTAANIDADKIGVTRTQNKIFTGGVSISFSTGTGLVVDDGLTVTTGGVTVTAGGLTVTAGGLTVNGGLTVMPGSDVNIETGNSVFVDGPNGIDYNTGGTDVDVSIATLGSPGAPRFYWSKVGGVFAFNKGLTLDTGGLTLTNGNVSVSGSITASNGLTVTLGGINIVGATILDGGVTVNNGGMTINAGSLVVTNGNITLSGAGATVDGVDVSAHAAANTGVHGIGGSTFATAATLTTHAGLDTGIHGVGGSTVASAADLTTHTALATGIHGAGADTLATDADITAHNVSSGVHQIESGNSFGEVTYLSKSFTVPVNSWTLVTLTSIQLVANWATANVVGTGIFVGGGITGPITSVKTGTTTTRATGSGNGATPLSNGITTTESSSRNLSFYVYSDTTTVSIFVLVMRPA